MYHLPFSEGCLVIKTADQIIFADPEISRVTSLVLQNGGSHVQLKGINTQALNKQYDKNKPLSIKNLQFSNADEILPQKELPHESRADLMYHLPFSEGRLV